MTIVPFGLLYCMKSLIEQGRWGLYGTVLEYEDGGWKVPTYSGNVAGDIPHCPHTRII